MSNVYQPKAAILHNQDGNWQQNIDGTWSEAAPLPYYGLKKKCQCGKQFWKENNYVEHYIKVHTDGKSYIRTPRGLTEETK